jgi:hypothetical protein
MILNHAELVKANPRVPFTLITSRQYDPIILVSLAARVEAFREASLPGSDRMPAIHVQSWCWRRGVPPLWTGARYPIRSRIEGDHPPWVQTMITALMVNQGKQPAIRSLKFQVRSEPRTTLQRRATRRGWHNCLA